MPITGSDFGEQLYSREFFRNGWFFRIPQVLNIHRKGVIVLDGKRETAISFSDVIRSSVKPVSYYLNGHPQGLTYQFELETQNKKTHFFAFAVLPDGEKVKRKWFGIPFFPSYTYTIRSNAESDAGLELLGVLVKMATEQDDFVIDPELDGLFSKL